MGFPWIFGGHRGAATWLPVAMGVTVIAYSLLTRYELGFVGMINMPVHLALDGLGASCWRPRPG